MMRYCGVYWIWHCLQGGGVWVIAEVPENEGRRPIGDNEGIKDLFTGLMIPAEWVGKIGPKVRPPAA